MEEGDKTGMDITDKTDSKVLSVRRTIYLTIMSRSGDHSNYRSCNIYIVVLMGISYLVQSGLRGVCSQTDEELGGRHGGMLSIWTNWGKPEQAPH